MFFIVKNIIHKKMYINLEKSNKFTTLNKIKIKKCTQKIIFMIV